MTIEEARKILGKDAEYLTDEEISFDIETALFFSDIFFDELD